MQLPSYNKYSNTKTTIDGITFASKKEAGRYSELKLLEKAGEITHLKLQMPFILNEGFIDFSGQKQRPITYVADFVYLDKEGKIHAEDCKGFKTPEYKVKKKMFLYKFPHYIFSEI
jgi:hypothetical protein